MRIDVRTLLTLAQIPALVLAAPLFREEGFEEIEGEHFIVHYHIGDEQRAANLLNDHENYYAFIAGFIGCEPPSRIEVYLCSTPQEWQAIGSAPYTPEEGSSAGQWSNGVLSYYNVSGGPGVAHELVHAIESQFLTFERPRWWVEGLACYLTFKVTGAPGPGGLYPDQLSDLSRSVLQNDPPLRTLGQLEGEVVLDRLGYIQSTSVFLFIEERYGEENVRAIVRAAKVAGDVRAAFQRVLQMSFAAFEGAWIEAVQGGVVAIAEARGAVGAAERDGRTEGLTGAKAKLSEAEGDFNSGKFLAAREKAAEAMQLAELAEGGEPGGGILPAALVLAVGGIVGYLALKAKRRGRG